MILMGGERLRLTARTKPSLPWGLPDLGIIYGGAGLLLMDDIDWFPRSASLLHTSGAGGTKV